MLPIEELKRAYNNLSELRRITNKAQSDLMENYLFHVKTEMASKFPNIVVKIQPIDDGFAFKLSVDYREDGDLIEYLGNISMICSNNFQEHLFIVK